VLPVEELYSISDAAVQNGSYDRAERYLKRLVARFPFGSYTEQSQLKLGFVQFKLDKYDEATATINRFIKTYPTHEQVDYAYYLRGLINFERDRTLFSTLVPGDQALREQGSTKQAFVDFSELIKRFPNSSYAPDARQRMTYLRNNLATHELSIAAYYFRRGAFIGALNRAKNVIESYQESPQAADALALMVQCYQKLEEPKLAEDTLAVLKLNAPEHPYVTGTQADRASWLRKLWPFGS